MYGEVGVGGRGRRGVMVHWAYLDVADLSWGGGYGACI